MFRSQLLITNSVAAADRTAKVSCFTILELIQTPKASCFTILEVIQAAKVSCFTILEAIQAAKVLCFTILEAVQAAQEARRSGGQETPKGPKGARTLAYFYL